MDGDYYGDEDLYESEEEELELEGSESAAQPGAGDPEDDNDDEFENAAEWEASTTLPEESWKRIDEAVGKLMTNEQYELTVLVLGSVGAGTSSTVNSLLAENVADVRSSPSGVAQPAPQIGVYTRRIEKDEFLLRVIDCPHLITADTLDTAALDELTKLPATSRIDVVLYVDRLDVFRVQPADRQLWETMRRVLGGGVWRQTITCLTHGNLTPPAGCQMADVVGKRSEQIAKAQRSCGAKGQVPYMVIDNASRCPTNSCGERVLSDGTVWLPALWDAVTFPSCLRTVCVPPVAVIRQTNTVVDRSVQAPQPLQLRQELPNPNRRRLWLLPLLLVAQVAAKVLLLDRLIEGDSWRGDKNGEYDPETQREQKLLAQTRRTHAQEEGRIRGKLSERRRPVSADVDMEMSGDPSLDDSYDDEDD